MHFGKIHEWLVSAIFFTKAKKKKNDKWFTCNFMILLPMSSNSGSKSWKDYPSFVSPYAEVKAHKLCTQHDVRLRTQNVGGQGITRICNMFINSKIKLIEFMSLRLALVSQWSMIKIYLPSARRDFCQFAATNRRDNFYSFLRCK